MSDFGAVGLVAVAVGMNAAKDVTKHHDPFPTLLAGAFLAFATAGVSDWIDPRLGMAFAAVFFLGSFLTSGVAVIGVANGLISSKKG
jgi:hypothetical protein